MFLSLSLSLKLEFVLSRSAERFDPREHSWTRVESMNESRGCHSLVEMNEKLYVLSHIFFFYSFEYLSGVIYL